MEDLKPESGHFPRTGDLFVVRDGSSPAEYFVFDVFGIGDHWTVYAREAASQEEFHRPLKPEDFGTDGYFAWKDAGEAKFSGFA